MSAGAPPCSPDPLFSLVVAPSDPVAMPPSPPPPTPRAAEEDEEERPWPPMKMELFPYAAYWVFGGMGRTWEQLLVAYTVIHSLNIIVSLLCFYTNGEQARFWTLVSRVTQSLGYASTCLIACAFIRYYMRVDGHLEPAPAAAAELLPPPPPEMDMC